MMNIEELLTTYINENLHRIILSNAASKERASKVRIRPILLKGVVMYQCTETHGPKEIHKNCGKEEVISYISVALQEDFRQMQLEAEDADATVLVSKKGRMTVKCKKKMPTAESSPAMESTSAAKPTSAAKSTSTSKPTSAAESAFSVNRKNNSNSEFAENCCQCQDTISAVVKERLQHNRRKKYILETDKPIPFLVDLGVMSSSGKIIHAKYDKFRQMNRYLEFIEDILPKLPRNREITIIDFGCGKSYLTFAMYYYLYEQKGYDVNIIGLDLKTDVIAHCNELAARYDFKKLHFYQGDIASYEGVDHVDMVVTLHACDTATDFALAKAVAWGAEVILSVPCCQHELNRQIANDILKPIMEYGILKERMAALLTDGLRAEMLKDMGYKVDILEFIDMEHTPKNLLIRAIKKNKADQKQIPSDGISSCMEFFQAKPMLKELLYHQEAKRT